MYLAKAIIFASLVVLSTEVPIHKRADLLQVQDYAQFQISDGLAGNALQEVAEKFPVDEFRANLAGVSQTDLAILDAARKTAESAETSAGGFNDAIEQVGEESDDGQALQAGKIKNKVLKLELEVLVLQIEQAQGSDNQDKIDEEQQKLDNNVVTDKESAGNQSQSVNFEGTSQP
ncbi:Fc.00g077980.m01.CDS01 [Cosmosporella sp. VM-42]